MRTCEEKVDNAKSTEMTTQVDGLYVCPYNKSHLLEWHRLPNHLVRCRKNNPGISKSIVICPYNQCHHVPKESLEIHLKDCQDHHTFKAISVKPASCESLSQKLDSRIEKVSHLQSTPVCIHGSRFPASSDSDSSNSTTDMYAKRQHEKNLDDLDEWLG